MTATRTATLETLFGRICRATPGEARDLAMLLTPAERAEMALFCYGRTHTREQGRAIAAACERDDLVRAGGQAGAVLFDQAEARGDTWGAVAAPAKRSVSLAG